MERPGLWNVQVSVQKKVNSSTVELSLHQLVFAPSMRGSTMVYLANATNGPNPSTQAAPKSATSGSYAITTTPGGKIMVMTGKGGMKDGGAARGGKGGPGGNNRGGGNAGRGGGATGNRGGAGPGNTGNRGGTGPGNTGNRGSGTGNTGGRGGGGGGAGAGAGKGG
jgi:hypothetical protein